MRFGWLQTSMASDGWHDVRRDKLKDDGRLRFRHLAFPLSLLPHDVCASPVSISLLLFLWQGAKVILRMSISLLIYQAWVHAAFTPRPFASFLVQTQRATCAGRLCVHFLSLPACMNPKAWAGSQRDTRIKMKTKFTPITLVSPHRKNICAFSSSRYWKRATRCDLMSCPPVDVSSVPACLRWVEKRVILPLALCRNQQSDVRENMSKLIVRWHAFPSCFTGRQHRVEFYELIGDWIGISSKSSCNPCPVIFVLFIHIPLCDLPFWVTA